MQKMNGRVSLIIPFYNEEQYIGVCLDSVVKQTYADIQLILVDDGSTDGSAEIIEKRRMALTSRFSEFIFLRHETNQNQSAAMNTALPYCDGEFLMWMDADDLIESENVSKKVSYLTAHPDLQMVRTNGIVIGESEGKDRELASEKDKKEKNIFEALILGSTYCHNGCYMIRTEALEKQLSSMRIPVSREGQNMQLLLPVASVSDCGYIDECLFTYRLHDKNHHNYAKDLEESRERIHGFETLYLEILSYCNCDRERYSQLIHQMTDHKEQDLLREEAGNTVKLDVTKNTTRNVSAGLVLKVVQELGRFIIRTVIIYYLGIEYAGINGLFTAVMQILNIAELDIGSAIVISMYQPIAEGNHRVVNGLLELYRRYYRRVGFVILGVGLCLLPFVNHLVSGEVPSDVNLQAVYLLQLLSTVVSYLFYGYQSSLLQAHQRNDVSSKLSVGVTITQSVLQIAVLIIFRNLYLYLAVGLAMQVVSNLLIHWTVSRIMYPDYHAEKVLKPEEKTKATGLIGDAFTHRIGGVIVNSADTIIISMVLGLVSLAQYQNYYMIMRTISSVPSLLLNSSSAGLGNRFVYADTEEKMNLFRRMTFLFLCIAGFCMPCFLCLFQPFIRLWVGETNLLSYGIVILLVCYFFILEMMSLGGAFEFASGCFHQDRFRPLAEGILNLTLNIILVHFIGLYGILLSTILSMLLLSYPWLLYNLFRNVFHRNIRDYLRYVMKYLCLILAICLLCCFVCFFCPSAGIAAIISRGIVCTVISVGLLYLFSRHTDDFVWLKNMIFKILPNHNRKS